jgi:carbonic anhydrase
MHAEKKDGETPKQTAPFGALSQTELRGDREYARLFEGNRLFVSQKLRADPNYFTRLSQGQQPKFLLIGCSDSRVPPDQLTMTEPGEIFIHRNVANIGTFYTKVTNILVVNTDMNAMSVLAYSVQSLKVRHVIVMGHYG